MKKEDVLAALKTTKLNVTSDKRMSNNYGDVLHLSNGCIINIYDSGKLSYQGKHTDDTQKIVESMSDATPINKKVFVVYGHDSNARTELEAMLRRWDLEPLIIDQLETSGNTIIEKLEEYIPQANFGIVLATPDDMGYPKDNEKEKKYRVRQNVVLEMGMLLAHLGRDKVAILLKNTEEMEKPSDIHGLIYIPFSGNVEDAKVRLIKEINRNGYEIDISKL